MIKRLIYVTSLLAALQALPAAADGSFSASHSAAGVENRYDRRDIARRAPLMPMIDAVRIATARFPGTVLAAHIETNDGIRTYEIDLMSDAGCQARLWLNASTGKILRFEDR